VRRGTFVSAAAIAAVVVSGAPTAGPPSWTTYGADPGRTGVAPALAPPVRPTFVLPLRGRVTSQVLAARDVPSPGLTTLYVTTSAGVIYAVSETGYVRWRVDLGQIANECPQLDGYGVTGTPVLDLASGTLYAVDALGRLHALALATGAERSGWPVQLYDDPEHELVWGALSFADGRVYAATGSYCDFGPFEGKVIAVDVKTQHISSWTAVPLDEGGGGGMWGWGGVAYSPRLDRLFVATGNAFEGGTNTGTDFTESAGHGEEVVALSPELEVAAASHPASLDKPLDLDFAGSPVVFDRPGCGELVVAHDKNAQIFGWRANDLEGGRPLWTLDLEPFDSGNPVLSQLAYDSSRHAVFAVTGAHLVRVDIGADCSASIAWSRALGTGSLNGSPTIAGVIWYARSDRPALVAADADSGSQVGSVPLPGLTVTAPTIVDDRIFVGTFTGQLVGFASSGAASILPGPDAPAVPGHESWLDARHGWVSGESGVFSTDDGGRTWSVIFPQPAVTVIRTSLRAGLIRVAAVTAGCACAYDLWTVDGGRHWNATRAIAGGVIGRGGLLYWLGSGAVEIRQVSPWPPAGPIRSRTIAAVDTGKFVALALVPGGVAGLVKDPSGRAASIVEVRAGRQNEWHELPRPPGMLITQSLRSSGFTLIVDGTVFSDGATTRVRWTSADDVEWQVLPG
jgi:hypothetical protein